MLLLSPGSKKNEGTICPSLFMRQKCNSRISKMQADLGGISIPQVTAPAFVPPYLMQLTAYPELVTHSPLSPPTETKTESLSVPSTSSMESLSPKSLSKQCI